MEGFGEIITLKQTAEGLEMLKFAVYKKAGINKMAHKNSKMTETYAHVSTKNLSAIKNQLIAL